MSKHRELLLPSVGAKTYNLTNGENYSATGGFGCSLSKYRKFLRSYSKILQSIQSTSFINGPSGGDTIFESQAKANKLD